MISADNADSQESGFHSRDCVVLFDDRQGDTKVKPIPPERMKQALAEREKIARWKGSNSPNNGNALKETEEEGER